MGHVYVRQDGLAGVIVTDAEYPQRVAFSALNRIIDEFTTKFPSESQWRGLNPANTTTVYPELKQHLDKFQDPQGADPFLRVQKELDETKVILVSAYNRLFLHKLCGNLLNGGFYSLEQDHGTITAKRREIR